MTVDLHTVTRQQTIGECMALMTNKRIRHLPVVEDDALLGLVSIGDVVKALIADQEYMIEQLERYITG
jgi:CBS domain-containing protein